VADADKPDDGIARVWLTVVRPVELAPGVLLPAGTYSGKSRRIAGSATAAGTVEYVLEFSAAALRRMGAEPPPAGAFLKEFNVTEFVTVGRLIVS